MKFHVFYGKIRRYVGRAGVLALLYSIFAWLVIMGYYCVIVDYSLYHLFSFLFLDLFCFIGIYELMWLWNERGEKK